MIDLILTGIALAIGTAGSAGESTASTGAPAVVAAPAFQAETQTPTGRFTTATEVKPILTATKMNWVAVRDYNGQDLVYVTHLLSWRCGLHEIRYAVNDGPLETWPMPPCLLDTAQPNAIRTEDGLPFIALPPGHVQSIRVELLYDDLSEDAASFERAQILMP